MTEAQKHPYKVEAQRTNRKLRQRMSSANPEQLLVRHEMWLQRAAVDEPSQTSPSHLPCLVLVHYLGDDAFQMLTVPPLPICVRPPVVCAPDVHGPSVPTLMNLARAGTPMLDPSGRMLPLENYGVKCMSMGFLIPEQSAAVWRGPMVMGALGKMIRDTAWAPLDILFVDMPPGTGDAHISVAQKLPLTGAVVVSTPQELALADARRGVDMYAKINAPVLGFVENMAWLKTPDGERVYVFGRGGVRRQAEASGVELLGEVPLDPSVVDASDRGAPVAVADPGGEVAGIYAEMARRIVEKTEPFGSREGEDGS